MAARTGDRGNAVDHVIPGAGHLVLRRWRSAGVWAAGFVLSTILGWQMLGIETLGDSFDPNVIRRGLLISAFLAVLRVAAIVDVLWITNSFITVANAAFGSLVVLIAVLPHLIVQVQGQQTATALETVFAPTTTTTTRQTPSEITSPTVVGVEQDEDDFGVDESLVTSTTLAGEVSLPVARPLAPAESIRYFDQRQQLALGQDGRFTVIPPRLG